MQATRGYVWVYSMQIDRLCVHLLMSLAGMKLCSKAALVVTKAAWRSTPKKMMGASAVSIVVGGKDAFHI